MFDFGIIPPAMFVGMILFMLYGFPVAFSLAAVGLFFGIVGIVTGHFDEALLQALPLRFFGIVSNDLLLAIPFFTFMGAVLERCGLAEDLLVLSRTESGRLEVTLDPVLMGHLVRRRVADEAAHWPAHNFVAEVPPGVGLVLGEEMYVEQVVQNLLSNAAKYSAPGTEVRVVVEQEAGEIRVKVLDEGIGLADESTERLFELFYRSPGATRQASGAGIGLFVCRQLIESMGGRIWAKRREERGSEFGFALPVLEETDPDELPG